MAARSAFSQSPATVAAGQTAWLLGSDLGVSGVSDRVYLLPPAGGAEVDVTAWAVAADSGAARFVLVLPATAGPAPARRPGARCLPAACRQRRAGLARRHAQRLDADQRRGAGEPASRQPASRPGADGTAPVHRDGAGLVPGATEVLVGTVALTETTASPEPGEVSFDSSGSSFSFSPPPGPAGTVLPVRVRVNGIESDPAVWVML